MNNKCLICHRNIEESETVCKRERCKQRYEARVSLNAQIRQFKEFWDGKIPNEANYTEYLTLIGKEDKYQEYITDLAERGFAAPSRRVFFNVNVISVHATWPDEFGRSFVNGMD